MVGLFQSEVRIVCTTSMCRIYNYCELIGSILLNKYFDKTETFMKQDRNIEIIMVHDSYRNEEDKSLE